MEKETKIKMRHNPHTMAIVHFHMKKSRKNTTPPFLTNEFLRMKIRALPLNGKRVGDFMDRAYEVFDLEQGNLDESSRICEALRLVGIRVELCCEEGDPPTEFTVAFPDRLFKKHPELKPYAAQIDELIIRRKGYNRDD